MKICPKCGTEVEKLYCPDCGTKVEEENARNIDLHVEEKQEADKAADVETEASYEVRQEIVPVPQVHQEYKAGSASGKISAKSTAIIGYIGWIGLIIALILGDKEGAKFHLNQALVIYLASIIISIAGSLLPILGGVVVFAGGIFTLVCWGLGLYYAITQQEKEVPLIGQIKLL